MRLLPIALLVAVLVYALIDCGRTPKQEMPGGLPKALWLTMIVVLVGVGPLTWIIVRAVALSDRPPAPPARPGQGPGPSPRPPKRPSPRPSAPDDDPAFLARLEAERRRAARERDEDGRTGDGGADPADGGDPGGTARGEGGRTARGEGGGTVHGDGGRRGRAGAGGQNGDRRTGSAQDEPGGSPEDRGSTRREEGPGDEPPKDESR